MNNQSFARCTLDKQHEVQEPENLKIELGHTVCSANSRLSQVMSLDLSIFCSEVCEALEQVIVNLLELEKLINILKIIEAEEGFYFNTCDFFAGLQLRNMALFFFLHSTHLLLDFCCYKLANTGWNWAAIKHASYQC